MVRDFYIQLFTNFTAGDLEITCFTNVTGDQRSSRTVTVFFDANRDATFRCRITGRPYEACEKFEWCA